MPVTVEPLARDGPRPRRAPPLVTLRPLTVADVTDRYVAWMNDPRVTAFLIAGRVPQTHDTVRAFVAQFVWPQAAAWAIVNEAGVHVGNTQIRLDWISDTGEVGILIGDPAQWRRGFAREAIHQVMRQAHRWGLRRLWAGTCNPACAALFRACGWTHEGTQPEHVWLNGGYHAHELYGVRLA